MDVFKILKESKFLNEFYNQIQNFGDGMYSAFTRGINHDKGCFLINYNEKEIVGLIIINNILFQHVRSFFLLVEESLFVSAFNEERAAYEILRLFRLYILDQDFRSQYLSNSNVDYRETRDNTFTQGKIIKRLEKITNNHNTMQKGQIDNTTLTSGSNFSQIHSELSKWAHGLNSNLIFPLYISNRKILMSIYNENNIYAEQMIRKHVEGTFILLFEHFQTLKLVYKFNKDFYDEHAILGDMYAKYINIFYKSDKSQ